MLKHATKEQLAGFEHKPAISPRFVFGEDINAVSETIRRTYRGLNYNHRQYLPQEASEDIHPWVHTEEFRVGQACFKHAVALVLQPRKICEIGVGAGISAMAFLQACPDAEYIGIDADTHESFYDLRTATDMLREMNPDHIHIFNRDSREISIVAQADLFHIDGGHDFETAKNDMRLAWKSSSGWILVDDANDSAVAAGVFTAIHELPHGKTDYAYFEDTWSGNLLFRRTG